jgi:hypothetical protein
MHLSTALFNLDKVEFTRKHGLENDKLYPLSLWLKTCQTTEMISMFDEVTSI